LNRRLVASILMTCLISAFAPVGRAAALPNSPLPKLQASELQDSYAIYSMLLRRWPLGKPSPTLGILAETTLRTCPVWPRPAPSQRATYEQLIENFKQCNARPTQLQRRFELPSYRLLSAHEADEAEMKHPPVPPPGGPLPPGLSAAKLKGVEIVFYLSAVGFSADHRRALVYIATRYSGRHYFLVKRHGKWAIDKDYLGTSCHWVS
jgi:hypothetical protein